MPAESAGGANLVSLQPKHPAHQKEHTCRAMVAVPTSKRSGSSDPVHDAGLLSLRQDVM
jgi:hypothetical protein